MLSQFAKLLKVMNSESNPAQIALAFVLGMIIGLTPLFSLHNLLILLFAFILRINFSAFLIAFAAFSALAYLADPIFIAVGEYLLTEPSLNSIWTTLYNSNIWRLSHFNNTLTLGSLICSLILAPALFVGSRILIIKYREHLLAWMQRSRLMRMLKANRLFRFVLAIRRTEGTL